MHNVNIIVTQKEPALSLNAERHRLLSAANRNLRKPNIEVPVTSAVKPGPFDATPGGEQYVMLFATVLVIVAAITAEVVVLAPKVVKGIELISLFTL